MSFDIRRLEILKLLYGSLPDEECRVGDLHIVHGTLNAVVTTKPCRRLTRRQAAAVFVTVGTMVTTLWIYTYQQFIMMPHK